MYDLIHVSIASKITLDLDSTLPYVYFFMHYLCLATFSQSTKISLACTKNDQVFRRFYDSLALMRRY